jgi:glycosyltransferase involved in cell wall biosynthesis
LPEFSIIVNCLNGEQFLKRSLDSIFNQTHEDWEVIFFDNNSSDSSAEIAKSYGSKIKYFKSDETYTLGKARDIAIGLAEGKFIAYLDVDDLWQPNKLEIQRSLFDDSIDFVYTNTLITDDDGNSFPLFKYSQPAKGEIFGDLLKSDFIPTSSISIRKASISKLEKRYDYNLTLECDRDFILRLSRVGRCEYTDECMTERFLHESNTIFQEKDASFYELEELKAKIVKIASDERNHKDSLNIFMANIDEKIARSYWNNGEKLKARRIFKKHRELNKHLILYLLTYILPNRLDMRMLSKIIRKVRR